MTSHNALGEDGAIPSLDFASESFNAHREPLRELINTFSHLYLDSEEDEEDSSREDLDNFPLPPPPPLEADRELGQAIPSVTPFNERLDERITSLEGRVEDCHQRVDAYVSQDEMENKCKAIKERLHYFVERECDRIKKKLEFSIQDLGRSVVDCLKRRDIQLDQKFKSLMSNMSTPKQPHLSSSLPTSVKNVRDQTFDLKLTSPITVHELSMQYNPPVKIDFPDFSNTQNEDPVEFIERCEEYFAVRPLSDPEILAALTTVLKGTAKDWWMAERRHVRNWKQFKETFLLSFLSEDYEEVAARKLLERKQGVKENIRDFAFHYRALCMRWKKKMIEREVVQAILRNCNPRLASLMRGTVRDVGELVKIGTQIERDFDESKRYWNQVNGEEQRRTQTSREPQRKPHIANNRVVQSTQNSTRPDINTVYIPIVIRDRYFSAMVDTGSTLSLIQESCWKQLCNAEPYQQCQGQSFMLANGQKQTALRKVNWRGEIQGLQVDLALFIMSDTDLTVPIILGMDFLLMTGIVLDFQKAQYVLPSAIGDKPDLSFLFLNNDV